jgi:hypothetical protein
MCVCTAVVHLDCLQLNAYYCPLCHVAYRPLVEDGANEEEEEEEGGINLTGMRLHRHGL